VGEAAFKKGVISYAGYGPSFAKHTDFYPSRVGKMGKLLRGRTRKN
jgi:hypothetical protein